MGVGCQLSTFTVLSLSPWQETRTANRQAAILMMINECNCSALTLVPFTIESVHGALVGKLPHLLRTAVVLKGCRANGIIDVRARNKALGGAYTVVVVFVLMLLLRRRMLLSVLDDCFGITARYKHCTGEQINWGSYTLPFRRLN